ncbi:MAG: type III secretion inner membrane ring lipoprotein SctJ [Desulfobacterales bacterium]|nr:type III secretion inner membrane ring lipoprotein SctJ [Desulfobacterales bacterium]
MNWHRLSREKLRIGVLVCSLILSACKIELYTDLTEKEANEMLALLLKADISSDKLPGQEGKFKLRVDEKQITWAMSIFDEVGLPKTSFVNMGDVFKKEGLISSPMEEKVRFIFALSQELSDTISQIEGVLAARVHIVLPDNNPLNETTVPSSASVFIKYRKDLGIEQHIAQIKNLVVNSIEGLTYDKVTIIPFSTEGSIYEPAKPTFKNVLGLHLALESVSRFWLFISILVALLIVSSAGGAAAVVYYRKKMVNSKKTTNG